MQAQLIDFHGASLAGVADSGTTYVAVRLIAQHIGLDADSAIRNLKADEVLGAELREWQFSLPNDQVRKWVCLPIQHVPQWLFGVQAAKVRPEVRAQLLLYKKEIGQALLNGFERKVNPIQAELELLAEAEAKLTVHIQLGTRTINEFKKELKRVNERRKFLGHELRDPSPEGLTSEPYKPSLLARV